MIEQTELIITKWHFHPAANGPEFEELSNFTFLEVMKKRAPTKKGIACRLTCQFTNADRPVLDYIAEHSYVIDLEDHIDKQELLKMIRNSFTEFNGKFDFRKLGTVLHTANLTQIDETVIDLDAIIPLLV
jgi:hypothetical protein